MNDSPLRFCFLTTFYPPYNFGGDGMGVQRLAHGLARAGHHVTVVHDIDAFAALHRGALPEARAEPPGVSRIGLRSGLGVFSALLTHQVGRPVVNGRKLRALLDRGHFDVINYHNVSLVGGPGILRLGSGIKLYMAHEHWLVCPTHVLWRHGREPCPARQCVRCQLSYRRPPQLWRGLGMLDRSLGEVDMFIAMSEFSRRKHREFGFPRDMEVLPYFLPDHEPAPASERTPDARPYFLFVGRLEKIKGLQDVIPIFAEYPDADLLIAGDGEYAEALRGLAVGLPNVRFLGRVDQEELRRYYADAVALIVPSVCFETFGIILIEAFREGVPVIARRIGPFPEIVEQAGAGELFDSPATLRVAMERLRTDPPHRQRLARAGRDAFLAHWSEQVVIPKYLDLVRRAAAARGLRLDQRETA